MTTAIATLATVSPESYLSDVPAWEPTIDDNVVTSRGENLTRGLGMRLVRRSDNGAPLAYVGMDYTVLTHRAMAGILDDVTAPFGGRKAIGPAKVYSGRTFAASVRMPPEVAQALNVGLKDVSKRQAGLSLRSSHDGSFQAGLGLWVNRLICSNGAVAPSSLLSARRKHTAGIVWMPDQIKRYADQIPLELESYNAHLRAFAALTFDRDSLVTTVSDFVGAAKQANEKIIDMVLAADNTFVPESTERGTYTGLQVFEAATAFDRHHRGVRGDGKDPGAVRLNRLLDGDTLGMSAWKVLSTAAGIKA